MSQSALNIAASGAIAHSSDLKTTANNIANINTMSYKANKAFIQPLLYASERRGGGNVDTGSDVIVPTSIQFGLGAAVASVTRDDRQGEPINTGNPIDMMIDGKGYFVLNKSDGSQAFTRNGTFQIDPSTNQLVTSMGYVVSPSIEIPLEHKKIVVRQDGMVLVEMPGNDVPQELGQMEIAYFANPNGLESMGDNMLLQTDASGEAQFSTAGQDNVGIIRSGFLEGSNVEPVQQMIRVMEAQMGYSLNVKMMAAADNMNKTLTAEV